MNYLNPEVRLEIGFSNSVFPQSEELLSVPDNETRIRQIAVKKNVERYVTLMDFIFCELYPQFQKFCWKFYKEDGAPLSGILPCYEITKYDESIKEAIQIASSSSSKNWVSFKKEVLAPNIRRPKIRLSGQPNHLLPVIYLINIDQLAENGLTKQVTIALEFCADNIMQCIGNNKIETGKIESWYEAIHLAIKNNHQETSEILLKYLIKEKELLFYTHTNFESSDSKIFYQDDQKCELCKKNLSVFGFFVQTWLSEIELPSVSQVPMCPPCSLKFGVGIQNGIGKLYKLKQPHWVLIGGFRENTLCWCPDKLGSELWSVLLPQKPTKDQYIRILEINLLWHYFSLSSSKNPFEIVSNDLDQVRNLIETNKIELRENL